MTTGVARKTLHTLAAHLLVFLQGLVLTPIVIKAAGPDIFGAYVLLISYLGIVFGISSMGVGVSAKRWLPGISDPAERAALFYPQFWFQILSALFLGACSVAAYAVLSDSLHSQFHGFSVWLLPAYLFSYTLYSQTSDYFRYTHRVGIYNVLGVAQAYLFVFLAIGQFWIARVLDAGSLVLSLVLSSSLVGGLLFFLIFREIGFRLILPELNGLGKEIRLGVPLVLAFLVDVILASGDRYIISLMLSVRDVGIYAPAYTLGSLVMVLPKVFGVVLPPLIAQRIDAGDVLGAKRLLTGASKVFLLVSIPYAVGAAILGKEVLRLYANDEVAEAAWPVISIVAIASTFYGLILIRANMLFVRLKTGALFQINLVSVGLNIVLNIVLIKLFGNVIVAAIATLASYLFSYLLLDRKLKGEAADLSIDMQWLMRTFLCSAGMALILALLASMLDLHGWFSVAFGVLAGSAAYAVLILMQRSNRAELAQLAQSVGKR